MINTYTFISNIPDLVSNVLVDKTVQLFLSKHRIEL